MYMFLCVLRLQQGPTTAQVVQRRASERGAATGGAKWRTEKARWQVAASSGASARPHRHRHVGVTAAARHHQTKAFFTHPF